MRVNKDTAVSTPKALLVPYDRRHVLTYHAWMEDPAIQEATASERLTLDEEYENQASWRASHDKLTFIICQPLPVSAESGVADGPLPSVQAGEADVPQRMVGDINLFLYPYEDEEGEYDPSAAVEFCVAEVDIMIAEREQRGKGLGRAVVLGFLQYVSRHLGAIMGEYAEDKGMERAPGLKRVMAKINKGNGQSIGLFRSLGFVQEGEVNYFGEVKLVLGGLEELTGEVPEGYEELLYLRDEEK